MLIGVLLIGLAAVIYQQSTTPPTPAIPTTQESRVLTLSIVPEASRYINYDPLSGQYVSSSTPMVPTTKTVVIGGNHQGRTHTEKRLEDGATAAPGSWRDEATIFEENNPSESHVVNEDMSECVNLHNYTLNFTHDSTVIHDKAGLNGFLSQAKSCGVSRFTVTGYASPDGKLSYNLKLAKRRAEAVKHYAEGQDKTLNISVVNPLTDNQEIKLRQAEITASQ